MRTKLGQFCALLIVAGAAACSSKGNRGDAGSGSDAAITSNDGGSASDAPISSNDGGSGSDAATKLPVPVQAGICPTELDDSTGKVSNQESWRFQPDKQYTVAVWLRLASLPSVPDCPGDPARDGRCAARDAALTTRQQLNVHQLSCVVGVLGTRVDVMSTLWYELPYHLTSGTPVPIGVAFGLSLTPAQITAFAQHPFVEKIEPWPGYAIAHNVPAAPPPSECPAQVDAVAAKLDRLTSIQGMGRQPVVIELRDEGYLPQPVRCDNGGLCAAAVDRLWERTILNTRQFTCVRSRLDAIVTADSLPVPFTSASGDPSAPRLPPASQPPATLKAFGRGLTWEEAGQLAGSPLVESIWTASGIQFEQPVPGCPPDVTAPIPTIACTTDQEPIAGKITDAHRMQFEAASGAMTVVIGAEGGGKVCPLPTCSVGLAPS